MSLRVRRDFFAATHNRSFTGPPPAFLLVSPILKKGVQMEETREVVLTASHAVELEPGVVLRPGRHPATETRASLGTMGQVTLAKPEYWVTLRERSAKYDVTKFVRSGELAVT